MDTLLTIVGLALVIVVAIWLFRRLARFVRSASSPEEALKYAREDALNYSWDEISVDRLDGKRNFRNHVERLSRPDVAFKGVAQLAQSATPGVAALGLSVIARRDDVPERWTDDVIRALPSTDWSVQAFVYRALLEQAKKPVIGAVLAQLGEEMTDTDALARFIQQRRERGEAVDVETFRGNVPPRLVEPGVCHGTA